MHSPWAKNSIDACIGPTYRYSGRYSSTSTDTFLDTFSDRFDAFLFKSVLNRRAQRDLACRCVDDRCNSITPVI